MFGQRKIWQPRKISSFSQPQSKRLLLFIQDVWKTFKPLRTSNVCLAIIDESLESMGNFFSFRKSAQRKQSPNARKIAQSVPNLD
jgi:hypothetical protein